MTDEGAEWARQSPSVGGSCRPSRSRRSPRALRWPRARVRSRAGAVVTTARNGAEALARVEQTRARVIVTDLAMPAMDGVEFVTRLRESTYGLKDHGGGRPRR